MITSQHPSFGASRLGPVMNMLPVLVILAGTATPGVARAQGFGPDPYRPYNSQYDAFVYPVAPGPLDYGQNQSPLRSGIRSANQFDSYMNSLRSNEGIRGPAGGIGSPYYRGANRVNDREGMNYQPNRNVDAKFESNQELITDLYFKYLREKDPKRRADLFRQYNQARSRAGRELASPRSAGPRPNTRTNRGTGAASATDTLERSERGASGGASTARRQDFGPPPPLSRGRSGARPDGGGDSHAGPAPPPIPRSSARGSSGADASLPSQVLDRAERSRGGLRARAPRPSTISPATP
jgi:hypothetical protein